MNTNEIAQVISKKKYKNQILIPKKGTEMIYHILQIQNIEKTD